MRGRPYLHFHGSILPLRMLGIDIYFLMQSREYVVFKNETLDFSLISKVDDFLICELGKHSTERHRNKIIRTDNRCGPQRNIA